ncbi:MAG: hypothetical protein V3T72_22505 [Thermoanaerobaculia bacterium]
MRHWELSPCQPLRPYVRLIWVLELDQPADFGPASGKGSGFVSSSSAAIRDQPAVADG